MTVFTAEEIMAALNDLAKEDLLEKRGLWFEAALGAGGPLSHVRFNRTIFEEHVPRAMIHFAPGESDPEESDELMDSMAEQLVSLLLTQERLDGEGQDTSSVLQKELKSLARRSGIGREARRGALMILLMLKGPRLDDEIETEWPLIQLFRVQLGELMDAYIDEATAVTEAMEEGTLPELVSRGEVSEDVWARNPFLRAQFDAGIGDAAERAESMLEDGPPLGFLEPHELLWLMYESRSEMAQLIAKEAGTKGAEKAMERWVNSLRPFWNERYVAELLERMSDWAGTETQDKDRIEKAILLGGALFGAPDVVLATAIRFPGRSTFYRNAKERKLAGPLVAALPNYEDGPWRKEGAGRRAKAAGKLQPSLDVRDASVVSEKEASTKAAAKVRASWLDPDALTAYRDFLESVGEDRGAENLGMMIEGE